MEILSDKVAVFNFDGADLTLDKLKSITTGDYEFKQSPVKTLRSPILIDGDHPEEVKSFINEIDKVMGDKINEYLNHYNIDGMKRRDKIILAKYVKSDAFPIHQDSTESENIIVAIMYLNNDYEGGALKFHDLDLVYTPKSGEIIVFPGHAMHSLSTITDGERYTIMYAVQNPIDNTDSI